MKLIKYITLKKFASLPLLISAFAVFSSASLHSAVITVTNPGFETSSGNFSSGGAPGYTTSNIAFGKVVAASGLALPLGGFGPNNVAQVDGVMYQNLGLNFVIGDTYTFTLSIGTVTGAAANKGFQFGFTSNQNDTVGGNLSAVSAGATTFIPDSSMTRGGLTLFSFDYVATTTQPVIIGLTDFYGNGSDTTRPYIDSISVSSVPEPDARGLIGVSIMAVLAIGYLKRQRA